MHAPPTTQGEENAPEKKEESKKKGSVSLRETTRVTIWEKICLIEETFREETPSALCGVSSRGNCAACVSSFWGNANLSPFFFALLLLAVFFIFRTLLQAFTLGSAPHSSFFCVSGELLQLVDATTSFVFHPSPRIHNHLFLFTFLLLFAASLSSRFLLLSGPPLRVLPSATVRLLPGNLLPVVCLHLPSLLIRSFFSFLLLSLSSFPPC
ncbi:putative transmembrane protein, partial [Toxoplasma gondii p89]